MADTEALVSAFARAAATFNLDALMAAHPGLTGRERDAAARLEDARDSEYRRRAGQRIRGAADPAAAARREQGFLLAHLQATGERITARALLQQVASDGSSIVLIPQGANPCRACRDMHGKVWSATALAARWPSHPGCQCRPRRERDARADGWRPDPARISEAASPPTPGAGGLRLGCPALRETAADQALREAAAELEQLAGCPGLSRVILEASVPAFDSGEHPRWPTGAKLGGVSVGGRFIKKVGIGGDVPKSLQGALGRLSRASLAGDLDGVEAGHQEMLDAARKLRDPTRREQGFQAAARARAAALNPSGERVRTGQVADYGDRRLPVPLTVPLTGQHGGWNSDGEFSWSIQPGSLGAGHDRLVESLRRAPSFLVTEKPGGTVQVDSAPTRDPVQANGDARRLEVLLPQLSRMRVDANGQAVENDPIDLAPEERETDLSRAQLTYYAGVSTYQIGASAETLIDSAAGRMAELELIAEGAPLELSTQERGNTSPLDWRVGRYAIEVKSRGMRGLVPGVAQEKLKIHADARDEKIAAAEAEGLTPALVFSLTDLDTDVAHLFFHEYPPSAPFGSPRPPKELVDRLISGDIRPGDDVVPLTGPDGGGRGERRFVFLGTFRLGYNPLTAGGDVDPDDPYEPSSLQTGRDRAARQAPVDVGARGPVSAPEDVTGSSQLKRDDSEERLADREERNRAIIAAVIAQPGVSQAEIARRMGVSQGTVSKLLKDAGQSRQRLPTRGRPLPERAVEMFDEGKDVRAIAAELKRTQDFVRKALKAGGRKPPREPLRLGRGRG